MVVVSVSGVLFAVGWMEVDDTIYVYTVNNDSVTDGITTFTFTCWVSYLWTVLQLSIVMIYNS